MTIPAEEKRAVLMAEQFLLRLVDPKKTARIPAEIRREASGILRHYPPRVKTEMNYGLAKW